ncbi:hypothetical protein CHISP_3553 [Chitinispirillum alkaliphilum]|nr:hypothetical protein CHISP_3553 [Chitinispirillum alkaliphilum]
MLTEESKDERRWGDFFHRGAALFNGLGMAKLRSKSTAIHRWRKSWRALESEERRPVQIPPSVPLKEISISFVVRALLIQSSRTYPPFTIKFLSLRRTNEQEGGQKQTWRRNRMTSIPLSLAIRFKRSSRAKRIFEPSDIFYQASSVITNDLLQARADSLHLFERAILCMRQVPSIYGLLKSLLYKFRGQRHRSYQINESSAWFGDAITISFFILEWFDT